MKDMKEQPDEGVHRTRIGRSGRQGPLSGTKTKYTFLILSYHPFPTCSWKPYPIRATLKALSHFLPHPTPPYMLFSLLCPFFSCPLLLVTACRHLHHCTWITVIWQFIWLKTKVVKGLGLYLARIGQCLAQNRHSGSIYWISLLWIENGIWHYFGHCVAGIME